MAIQQRLGLRTIKEYLPELWSGGYVPLWKAPAKWLRNMGNRDYTTVPSNEWRRFKKSDTVFVIGSGPSIEKLTPAHWDHIRAHDTFGINYSFVKRIPTTFHMFGYERNSPSGDVAGSFRHVFSPDIRSMYRNTLWFLPSKSVFRLVHPSILPDYFPDSAKIAIFHLPHSISLETDRPFQASDFDHGLRYRGSIGVVLTLLDQLNYKRIVLLGVDPQTSEHFVYKDPALREEGKKYYATHDPKATFEMMKPKGKRYRTIEEYFYAVRELYFGPKGTELQLGIANPILSPRIPVYSGKGWNVNA